MMMSHLRKASLVNSTMVDIVSVKGAEMTPVTWRLSSKTIWKLLFSNLTVVERSCMTVPVSEKTGDRVLTTQLDRQAKHIELLRRFTRWLSHCYRSCET